jgi:FkbM family methyltransferase
VLFTSPVIQRLVDRRVVVVDGGARGELVPPLDGIPPDTRTLVRFEADPSALIREEPTEKVVRGALWSEPGSVTLHVTHEPSCSSIHEPDERILSGFVDVLGFPARNVEQRVSVPSTTLDDALAEAGVGDADFIKLDIHGAEYEALLGSRLALSRTAVGVLVECWPVAIHAGQHSFAELDQLLQGEGFLPFDIALGNWPRRPPTPARYSSRAQSVQVEVLYLLDAVGSRASSFSSQRIAVLIAFAELFGQTTYAMQIARDAAEHGVFAGSDSDEIVSTVARLNHVPWWRHALGAAARRVRDRLDALVIPIAGR